MGSPCLCSTMKELSPDDRPREKLLRHGAAALGDNELVAVVLGSGRPRASALGVANDLLRARGGLHGLVRASLRNDLARVAGIGDAKAAQVLAAVELGRRTLTRAPARGCSFSRRATRRPICCRCSDRAPVEQFGVVLLDTKHRVIRTTVVASGGLNATIVEPRDVFREAMLGAAAAVVVFHNHPSGDPTPSPDDFELTRRLSAAGDSDGDRSRGPHRFWVTLRYYSFKEMGRL